MTRSTRLLVAAGAVAVLAGACASPIGVSPSPVTSTVTTVPEPAGGPGVVDGGTVVVGLGDLGAPRSLNPLLAGPDLPTLDVIRRAAGASAWRIEPGTLRRVPHLVEQIPSVSNGGIVDEGLGVISITYRIDTGARWSDGTPVTGDDFAFTYSLVSDPALPIRQDERARYAGVIPGSMRAAAGEVTFRARVGIDVASLFGIVVPRHQVEGGDLVSDWNDTMWASAGPFAFSSVQAGEYLELRRNQEYWRVSESGERLPLLDRVVVRFFDAERSPDPRLEQEFRGRGLDVVTLANGLDGTDPYRAMAARGVAVDTAPTTAWYQLDFQFGPSNRNAESLNRHLEFRRAVAFAIDRRSLAADLGNEPLHGFVGLSRPDLAADPWSGYTPDPDRVAGLLWELGERLGVDLFAGDGPRLVLVAPSANPATVELAGRVIVMLRRAGIGAELQLEESSLFFGATLDDGSWDAGLWSLPGGVGTAAAARVVELYDPDGLPFVGTNVFRWGTIDSTVQDAATQEYRRVLDQMRSSVDPAEADRYLLEAEQILADAMVLLPIAAAGRVGIAWWDDEVVGPAIHPQAGVLWNVEEWQRRPE